jgi:hypothetical protein
MAISLVQYSATSSSITSRITPLDHPANEYQWVYIYIKNMGGTALDEFYAEPPTGTLLYIENTWTGYLSAGTPYQLYMEINHLTDGYTIVGPVNAYTRPDNFTWGETVSTGAKIVTVTEWNRFTGEINKFRLSKGLASHDFGTIVQADSFTATIFNEARTAINDMSPGTTVPAVQVKSDIVYASLLNGLVSSLNSL